MIELLITACLIGDPAECKTVVHNMPTQVTMAQCLETGADDIEAWQVAHELYAVSHWQCSDGRSDTKAGFPIKEIATDVFVHRGAHALPSSGNANDLSNAGFVIGDEAVAVIDSGGSLSVGQRLLEEIRQRTDLPVRYLILTHMHPDHILGAKAFKDAGATIIGHQGLPHALSMRASTYETNMKRLIGGAYGSSAILLPDETVEQERMIDLGNRRLILKAHRTAHTDNDLTVLDEQTQTLFLGDLLFHGHTPALDGSIKGWLSLIEELSAMNVKQVVPGHGPEMLAWPVGLEAMQHYLKTLAAEVRKAIKKGDTMTHAIRHAAQSLRPNWQLFDEFHPRNVTAAYKELEWE